MVYLDIDDLYVTGKYGRIIAVVYVPYDETHYVNLNQLLLKEGYAEARDYRNEFDPDNWMGPLEYAAVKPSPVRSPLPIPGFEFLLAMGGGVVAAIYPTHMAHRNTPLQIFKRVQFANCK